VAVAAALVCALCAGPGGCASYTEEMRAAQFSIASGEIGEAIVFLNRELGVDGIGQVPGELDSHDTLLLLERATLLQAQRNYAMSSRDMMEVDGRLEWFDIDGEGLDDIASYFYSDDVKAYRAPAYERMLLNTLNLLNFVGMGDLEGARVEARRFKLLEEYYLDGEGEALVPDLIMLGNYVSGAVFEASGDYERALGLYVRAWVFGMRSPELKDRLRDLARLTSFRPPEADTSFFDGIYEDAQYAGALSVDEYRAKHQRGDTLVIVQYGVTPYKKAVRVEARRALGMAAAHRMTPASRQRAIGLVADGSLEGVNFPQLTDEFLPVRDTSSASLVVDGQQVPLALGMDVGVAVTRAWGRIEGVVMAAALTRMLARAVVGGAGRVAALAAASSGDARAGAVGALGWLAATGAQAAMRAADVPDTRSWTTLPEYIRVGRVQLGRGLHTAEVNVVGRADRQRVPIWPDRLNLINFSRLR
jgi:hypothetical protein